MKTWNILPSYARDAVRKSLVHASKYLRRCSCRTLDCEHIVEMLAFQAASQALEALAPYPDDALIVESRDIHYGEDCEIHAVSIARSSVLLLSLNPDSIQRRFWQHASRCQPRTYAAMKLLMELAG